MKDNRELRHYKWPERSCALPEAVFTSLPRGFKSDRGDDARRLIDAERVWARRGREASRKKGGEKKIARVDSRRGKPVEERGERSARGR